MKSSSDIKVVHDIPVGVIVTITGLVLSLLALFLPYASVMDLFGDKETIIMFGKDYDAYIIFAFAFVDAYLVLRQEDHYKVSTIIGGIVCLFFAIRRIMDLTTKAEELSLFDGMIEKGIAVYVLLISGIVITVGGVILYKTE